MTQDGERSSFKSARKDDGTSEKPMEKTVVLEVPPDLMKVKGNEPVDIELRLHNRLLSLEARSKSPVGPWVPRCRRRKQVAPRRILDELPQKAEREN